MLSENCLFATAFGAVATAFILCAPAIADQPESGPYRLRYADLHGSDPFRLRKADVPVSAPRTGGGASADEAGAAGAGEGDEALSPQCAAFQADPDADVGDIIRAGRQPPVGQMSALMDNPLGNVAMLFTQFDFYQLKEPNTGRTEDKYNYMGIAQFPKGVG